MKTITINLHTFDELTPEAQEKVIEKHEDINVDYEWWKQDGLLDLTPDEIKESGIELSQEWYKSTKQKNNEGNIVGEYPAHTGLIAYKINEFDIDRRQFINFSDVAVHDDECFRKFLKVSPETWSKISYRFTCDRNESTRLFFTVDNGDDLTENEQNEVDNAEHIFSRKVSDALKTLTEDYNYRTSTESIADTIRANDYMFEANGTMRNI